MLLDILGSVHIMISIPSQSLPGSRPPRPLVNVAGFQYISECSAQSTAKTWSLAVQTMSRTACSHTMIVLPLSCGVRSTSFLAKSGWPSGSGSSSATSSAAPAIFFSSSALSKAFLREDQGYMSRSHVGVTYVSIASPLPMLTTIA